MSNPPGCASWRGVGGVVTVEYYTFAELCKRLSVPQGRGAKTWEEIDALGASITMTGWWEDEPLVVNVRGSEWWRHPCDGNHRLRALWRFKAWMVWVPVRFEPI